MMDSEPTTEITIYDEIGHWIILDLCEPVTITCKEEGFAKRSQSFTSYLIRIETNHYAFAHQYSGIRRRYSEFCWLRAVLQRQHPNVPLPNLPPKKYLNMVRFAPRLIETRRAGLARFLEVLLASSMLLQTSPVIQLFVQSDLSIREMEEKLNESFSLHSFSMDSNGSDVGRQRYHPISRTSTNQYSTAMGAAPHASDSSIAPSSTSTAPPFVRSCSLASSGSDATTSGELPSLNSDQSSSHFFRNSNLIMFNCP